MGTANQIKDRIEQLGHSRVAITDHGNTFSHAPYSKVFKKGDVRPIYGVEFYIVDDLTEKSRNQKSIGQGVNAFPHITILARTQQGYENLLTLNRISWMQGFYTKPRIDASVLAKYSDGLIVLSGCPGGYPTRILLESGYEAAKDYVRNMRNRIEHYYVEVVPCPGLDISYQTSDMLAQIALELQIPMVLTSDAHFPTKEDHPVQDLLLCVGIGKRLNDPDRTLRLPEYQYYCSADELMQRAKDVFRTTPEVHLEQAINNTAIIAGMCDVEIPRGTVVSFPGCTLEKPAPNLLWEWVQQGLNNRYIEGKIPLEKWDEYVQRAQREHVTLANKGFCDYILTIGDVVKHIKDQGGLVMCRGSAGGSILLWLIGASETDPIYHDLSFERFYDENRPDPPDVDVDFEKAWRDKAIEYIFEKYGHDRCARLGALSQLTAKSALQDVSFAYGIPRSEFGILSDALDSKDEDTDRQIHDITDPDILKVLDKHPELLIFKDVIGQYRQSTIHACGVVVANEPLDKMIGIVRDKDSNPVAALDKHSAADLGFLKMDLLAVNSLDIIGRTARIAKGDEKWLYSLPLDDPETFEFAKNLMLTGIFQLDGSAAARVAREIKIDDFNDLVAASALCRPGPADWVETYRQNKNNKIAFEKYLGGMHPIAAETVRKTYGILLYQEQVMRLARELAGFEWPDVHKLRKGIASSGGYETMIQWKNKFIDGCTDRGIIKKEAEFWWDSISTHGSYSFNMSHCVTYGIISYWGLYLKTHYPSEFYESSLRIESLMTSPNFVLQKRLIREFQHRGGKVSFVDHENLDLSFNIRNNILTGGLCDLKGIGEISARKMIEKGPCSSYSNFLERLPKAVGRKLSKAHDGANWDPAILLQIAPWFPVPMTYPADEQSRWGMGFNAVGRVAEVSPQKLTVAGYVSYIKIDKNKFTAILEDHDAFMVIKISARLKDLVTPKMKQFNVGDYIGIDGWWSGSVMYASDAALIRRATQ
jgi:DNA polymerase-3 subunit alpha